MPRTALDDPEAAHSRKLEELELRAREVEIEKSLEELRGLATSRVLAVLLVGVAIALVLATGVCAVLDVGDFKVFAVAGSALATTILAILRGFRGEHQRGPPSNDGR